MSLYTMERSFWEKTKPWARGVVGISLLSIGIAGRASYRESSVDPGLAIAYALIFLGIAVLWSPTTRAVIDFVREVRTPKS